MSGAEPLRKSAILSCNWEEDFDEDAVARTKSTTVGSEAPVREIILSDVQWRRSMMAIILREEKDRAASAVVVELSRCGD